ncbi:type II secretion system protein [Anaerotalea alkaliphila]|uniref:Type II secretion system protein n=1 Tax=Anaerotalea alkaliphila TaxID=2662126 RepID=A0A7X5HY27_9FIRM|nr:type II secretion system protein [Anaerotalea alkaliphila]NDL68787.1 type II secretion system protein [Anaerotalea alkaliphila]
MQSKPKGSNVAELLAVLAILGILAGVAAPRLLAYDRLERLGEDKKTAEAIAGVLEEWERGGGGTAEEAVAKAFGGQVPVPRFPGRTFVWSLEPVPAVGYGTEEGVGEILHPAPLQSR